MSFVKHPSGGEPSTGDVSGIDVARVESWSRRRQQSAIWNGDGAAGQCADQKRIVDGRMRGSHVVDVAGEVVFVPDEPDREPVVAGVQLAVRQLAQLEADGESGRILPDEALLPLPAALEGPRRRFRRLSERAGPLQPLSR